MDLISKIGQILLILVVIYLWNRYVVKLIIGELIGFHRKNNERNLNKQPIKFFVENELNIINFVKAFYWFGGIIIILGIINE
jgi:F420-0:gamma-glutamyl ligase-like protein